MRSCRAVLANKVAHLHASLNASNRDLFVPWGDSPSLHSDVDILKQAIELTSEKGLNVETELASLPTGFQGEHSHSD